MDKWQLWGLISAVITQVITIFGTWLIIWKTNHSREKWIKEQISCKKREVWDIQKQITSIVCSGDKVMICSDYTKQLAEHLKTLKQEIADLNKQLKPKEQDHTKLNITESISALNDKITTILKGDK